MTQFVSREATHSPIPESYKVDQETVNKLAKFVQITMLVGTILVFLAAIALFVAGITCAVIYAAPAALLLSLSGVLLPGMILKCLSPNKDW